MPTIRLNDENGSELVNLELAPGQGLGRYVKGGASLRSLVPIVKALGKPLTEIPAAQREIAMELDGNVPVGAAAELSLVAGTRASLRVSPGGEELFGAANLQAPVTVPNGSTYVSFSLGAMLNAGVQSTKGRLSFGFEVGTSFDYAYHHRFDTAAQVATTKDAVTETLRRASIPADTDDLVSLPVGDYVTLAGEGELAFSGGASLSATTNLLATPGLPLLGVASLAQTGSVSVEAEWRASGEFELRVTRPAGNRIELSFYRRAGRALSISAKATAGISGTVRDNDLIAMLIQAVSPNPEADLLALVDAGLTDEQIDTIQRAVAASVDRSLSASAQLQISSLKRGEALFAYELEIDALNDESKAAVADALHGRLTALERLARAGTRGVRFSRIATARLNERKVAWRLNLFGILNSTSLATFLREGTLSFDPASGALNAADQITSTRIRVKTRPLESDTEKVRKVMFESLMVTVAYQASQVIPANVALTASHTYVEQHGRTRREEIVSHYRALIALNLCDVTERDTRLAAEQDFGASTFLLECTFDRAASDAMFLDSDGRTHSVDHYERIAREALLALIPADDPGRSFRRMTLERDAVWARLKGSEANLRPVLPSHIGDNPLRLGIVTGDFFTVVWWASAMHRAGTALLEMRQFLAGRDAASLESSKPFREARSRLEGALAAVVASSKARFEDPWEMIALDTAAGRAGTVRAVIVSPKLSASYDDSAEAVLPAAPSARSMRGSAPTRVATRSGSEPRQWTNEERAILDRHVVNLRAGKLSTEGQFASSDAQLQRIFTEVLPKELRARKAAHEPLRLVFYAHGGLTDELEGLLPVLARERFWRLNGLYPIAFVWETGLMETFRDIVGRATRAAPTRGGIADLAIESAAREPGKLVWGRMKKSAEQAVGNAGGARQVARLTSELWQQHPGDIEMHAVGHSAGAIFVGHFLPALLEQRLPAGVPPLTVESLHLLAPAITTAAFKRTLQPLVGPGRPIRALTMYTMTDELEQRDESAKPYGKSLLYLVSKAFEEEAPTAILGLQESLRRDAPLIRFFGLAGREQVAEVVFSRTAETAGLASRSASIRHGGFDNDVLTMTSVARRMLGAPDTVSVVDYFEDAVEGRDRPTAGTGPSPVAGGLVRGAAVRAGGPRAPAARRAVTRKPWAVLVWMAGDNNLESFGDRDLAEMKRVGSTDDIHVVAQFDSMRDDRTRRYHLQRSTGSPDEDVVEELGETNTGDPAVAVDFFTWALDRFPADRVLTVIWNHGSGIDDTDVYARAGIVPGDPAAGGRSATSGATRGTVRAAMTSRHRRALFRTTVDQAVRDRAIAYDDSARDFLDNQELQKVLAEVTRHTGRTIDLVGFDACLMNMLEIAYQLRSTAQCIVGSEEIEPGDGWPYDRVLKALAARPTMTGRELGKEIVEAYVASYQSDSVTQSVLELSAVENAAAKVDALAKALKKAIKTPAEYVAVSKALNATQRFRTADFVDLASFCQELATRTSASAVKTATAQVTASLTGANALVAAERHKGTGVAGARGVAVYFPRGPVNKAYAKLDFAKSTAWSDFLEAFHTA